MSDMTDSRWGRALAYAAAALALLASASVLVGSALGSAALTTILPGG